ncbi:DUF262 domain-containing protein [Cellulosilyticum sp. WCF-2]|uniref:DUF262 domain-containing protein n=1 Tax=Cellulosilyticum sp. WCF-2 TaxID=2497860 RepID=UPI001680957E|nr:DUF262 domain-containing protein [Cellulosilyticum sp. WCF-2]
MEPIDFFTAKERNILSLFTSEDRVFRVPDYQRNFAWTEDELEQFWLDFKQTVNNTYDSNYVVKRDAQPHFFGTILLIEGDNCFEVTDGQQRMTVSTIFLKGILDISQRLENYMQKSGIHSYIVPLIEKNRYGEPYQPRLSLDSTIDEMYRNYILKSQSKQEREQYLHINPIQNSNSSKERLRYAYEYLSSKLEEDFPETLEQEEIHKKLYAYMTVFSRYFMLLEITVTKKETAYTIFGTINARGKDLTDSDIIKNEIFKAVDEEKRHEIKAKWDYIIDTIETEDLTDYLRFQYASCNGSVKKIDLFRVITKLLSQNDPMLYLDQLKVEAEWYARINLIGTNYWSDDIISKLKAFKQLDISHSLPLLLASAVLFNTESEQFNRLVNATLVFCFRYFTMGKNSVENLEREIGKMSKDLRRGAANIDQTIMYMKTLTNDTKFYTDFSTFSTKSSNIAFYILCELEKKKRSGVIPLPHSPGQHVEHIMPQKPSSSNARQNEWGHVRNNPEYREFVNRLGNLLILESDLNKRVSNKEFIAKKIIYLESGLAYPNEIAAIHSIWDFGSITRRQNDMAIEALEIWKYI